MTAALRLALPAWFVAVLVIRQSTWLPYFGVDAYVYRRAAEAWLEGGDPWAVAAMGTPFAAAPPVLLFYAPFALLPETIGVLLLLILNGAAALIALRMLRLPSWWLLFPPVVQALWAGDAVPVVLVLLLLKAPWATAAGVGIKLWAGIVPTMRLDWRGLAVTMAALAVSLLVLPWGQYLERGAGTTVFTYNHNLGAWSNPILLVVPTALALLVIGGPRAAWLAVPAILPATQIYYATLALPALGPWSAAILAWPDRGVPSLLVIGLALVKLGVLRPFLQVRRDDHHAIATGPAALRAGLAPATSAATSGPAAGTTGPRGGGAAGRA